MIWVIFVPGGVVVGVARWKVRGEERVRGRRSCCWGVVTVEMEIYFR